MEGTQTQAAKHARPPKTKWRLHDGGDSTGEASRSAAPAKLEVTTNPRKEAFAHLTRDESQVVIHALILELSVRISRRWVALVEASSMDSAKDSDDIAALAWIQRSLEDVEATIIGLSKADPRHSAAFEGPASSSAGE
jgi:hypothetical protein